MKIVIADSILPEVCAKLEELGTVLSQPKDLNKELVDADVLIVRSATKVTKSLLSNAKRLKVVARAGVGTDNIDSEECDRRGIKIINTPAASTNAVAEMTIGLLLSLFRNIYAAHTAMKQKQWEKKKFVGKEIAGKTLGVIGFGRIGASVGEKAHALGMNILAYDPYPNPVSWVTFVELDELYKRSDVISLHTILSDQTKHMINKGSISKMKDGVYLINIARGELVEEEALYLACKSRKIAAVALDVYPQEPYTGKLLELDNICFSPHLGASTKEAQVKIGYELVDKLKHLFSL